MVMDFIKSPDKCKILFTLNSAGLMTPMDEFIHSFKTKVSYIVKLDSVEITNDNFESQLICGEVSSNPIEDLKTAAETVSEKCHQSLVQFILFN
jgi:hypothetical protein